MAEQHNVATIASVHWKTMTAIRPYREFDDNGHMTTYTIEGINAGEKPALLRVKAAYAVEHVAHGNYNESLVLSNHVRARSDNPMRDSAREIAKDLVNEWTQQSVGMEGLGPGIFVCKIPLAPSRAEVDEARAKHGAWARYVVNKAAQMWMEGNRNAVVQTDFYRQAARYIGQEDHEWIHNSSPVLVKPCPFCGKNTNAGVPVCQHCNRVHDPELMKQIEDRLPQIKAEIAKVEKEFAPPPAPEDEPADTEEPEPAEEEPAPVIAGTLSQAYQRKLEKFKSKPHRAR